MKGASVQSDGPPQALSKWWDLLLLAPSVWDLGHHLQRESGPWRSLGAASPGKSQEMATDDLESHGLAGTGAQFHYLGLEQSQLELLKY